MANIDMLPLPDVQRLLIDAAPKPATETIATAAALDRVLAESIVVPHAFPDTRRSAVDGFAISAPGLEHYRVIETLGAGELPQQHLKAGEAAAVMTGATVPAGSFAVARVEDSEIHDDILTLKQDVSSGENINPIGAEMAQGKTIYSDGTRLGPVKHSVLCCTGIAKIKVFRLPKVGILITGNEVLQLGEAYRPGGVYDSNRYFLAGCFAQLGIPYQIIGPVPDNETSILNSLDQLAEECDLVISSGGVSMGKYDFIRPLLHANGFEILVNRTRIKPGRPLMVARRNETLFFALPGYPAACLVNFFYYLLPTVRKLMGLSQVSPLTRRVTLGTGLQGRKGRWDIIRMRLQTENTREYACKLDSQLTSHFLNFAACDGLALLDNEVDEVSSGQEIDFLDFRLQF